MYFTGPSVYRIERPGPESTPSPKLSHFVYPPDANAAVDAARRPDWGRILATLIRLARDEAPATVRFTKRNDFGILDRHADARPRIPMRVIANGTGNGVVFALFRRNEMTDKAFARDAGRGGSDLTVPKEPPGGDRSEAGALDLSEAPDV